MVDVEQGQVVRHVDPYAAAIRDVAQHLEGFGHQLIERNRDRPHLESSRFDACHVEQIGDEPGELVRLLLNQLEQFGTVLRRELDVGAAQTRNRRLDRGQRRPQVVRDGPHERAAPAVDLLEQPRPQRLVAQPSPVHGESRLIGEGTEQAPFPGQLRILQHEHSHRPIVEHQGHGDPRRRFGVGEPERARLSAGDERRQLDPCQFLTRRGSHVQTFANIDSTRLAVRQDQGSPPGGEGFLHRTHDMGHQLVEGEITDQSARQVVEAARLVRPAKRLLPRRAQVRHDLRHDEDHYEIDEERNPVLRTADGQGLVGRQEEIVVSKKAGHRAHATRHEPGDDHSDQSGQDEGEGGNGDAQMEPEGKEHGQEYAERGQGDDDGEERALVGFLQGRVASHGHCFPSVDIGPTSECTDGISWPGQARAQ